MWQNYPTCASRIPCTKQWGVCLPLRRFAFPSFTIVVVLVLAIFYGIFLGVKYAQAEDEATKANMQKTLINFIIGAVVVVILIGVLAAIYKPLGRWITARD